MKLSSREGGALFGHSVDVESLRFFTFLF